MSSFSNSLGALIKSIPFEQETSREALILLIKTIGEDGLHIEYKDPAENNKRLLQENPRARTGVPLRFRNAAEKNHRPENINRHSLFTNVWGVVNESGSRIRPCGGAWGASPDEALNKLIASLNATAKEGIPLVVGNHSRENEEGRLMFVIVRPLDAAVSFQRPFVPEKPVTCFVESRPLLLTQQ